VLADDLAALHRSTADDRFGWHHHGYLCRLRQVNTWTANGHEFFAQHRLLRKLTEPPAEHALTTADRRAVERLCARLPEVIPTMPAALTHGDLWANHLREQLSVIALRARRHPRHRRRPKHPRPLLRPSLNLNATCKGHTRWTIPEPEALPEAPLRPCSFLHRSMEQMVG
jgi:hypothetical protein